MSNRSLDEIDLHKLQKILELKPTLHDTAAIFDCSEDTIERRIRANYDMTFRQYRDRQVSKTRNALIQKAVCKALEGDNVMLIFSLKNMCDWADKREVKQEGSGVITIAYDPSKLGEEDNGPS